MRHEHQTNAHEELTARSGEYLLRHRQTIGVYQSAHFEVRLVNCYRGSCNASPKQQRVLSQEHVASRNMSYWLPLRRLLASLYFLFRHRANPPACFASAMNLGTNSAA